MSLEGIRNTPGFFYAIGYACSAFVVLYFPKTELPIWKRRLYNISLLLVLIVFMYLTHDVRNISYFLAIGFIVLCIYFRIYQTVKDTRNAGACCVKVFIYGEFSASAVWLVYYDLGMRFPGIQKPLWMAGIMAVLFGIIFIFYFLTEKKIHSSEIDLQVTARDLAFLVISAVTVFAVSNMSYVDPDGIFSGSRAHDIFALRTLADLAGVVLIVAIHSQMVSVQLLHEKDALHNIMEMQYQAFQISRESMDMVNQKYHDLKHQLTLFQAQADSQKTTEYLDQLKKEIKVYEIQNKTGNAVLDVMLASKGLYCQKHGIELKYMADGSLLNFMEDMDLSALFGNMLDNAIEGVERLKEPEKRLIRLYIGKEKQFILIRLENYCEERVRFQGGLPLTSKNDRHYHGFGVKSMDRTVTKYGGSLITEQKDNWFELKILIPASQQENDAGT